MLAELGKGRVVDECLDRGANSGIRDATLTLTHRDQYTMPLPTGKRDSRPRLFVVIHAFPCGLRTAGTVFASAARRLSDHSGFRSG